MSDYNFLMETRLSPEQFQVIQQLSRSASGQSVNLYLAGGAVRDLTYGQQVVRDLDFVVEGSPEKVLRTFRSKPRPGSDPTGLTLLFEQEDKHFNSWSVVFSNGVRAEISMARNEIYDRPGKKPQVEPATIFEDLRRRDFTVNAMAISLHQNSRGLLLDPTNGAGDIERRELRAMHTRSFSENPVRIYRLMRLGMRLGFKVEERTEVWRNNALENGAADRLDPEQQGSELSAILREENPGKILKTLAESKLISGLDRKLGSSRPAYEQFTKIRSVAQSVPGAEASLVHFHALVSRLAPGERKRLAKKIFVDSKEANAALGLEASARKLTRLLSGAKMGQPSHVFMNLSAQPVYMLLFLLAYFPKAAVQTRVKNFLFKYPMIRARIPRAELLAQGFEPGPKFEKIVHQLFLMQIDGKIKSHPQLLKEFRAMAGIKEPKPAEAKPEPKPAKTKSPPLPANLEIKTKAAESQRPKVNAPTPKVKPVATKAIKPVAKVGHPGRSKSKGRKKR